MPATSPRANLVVRDAALAERIIGRAQRALRPAVLSAGAAAELGVFDTLLSQELRRIRLTLAEARALAAVVLGDVFDPYVTGPLLFADASDAFRLARQDDPLGGSISSYAVSFGIDEAALLDKLLAYGPTADLALRDALSRWWSRSGERAAEDSIDADEHEDDDRHEAAGFRAVGMTIIADPEPTPDQ